MNQGFGRFCASKGGLQKHHLSGYVGAAVVCMSVRLSVRLSVCLSVRLSVCLSACLPACLPVRLSVSLPVCLSVCLSVCAYISIYIYIYVLHMYDTRHGFSNLLLGRIRYTSENITYPSKNSAEHFTHGGPGHRSCPERWAAPKKGYIMPYHVIR